MKENLFTCLLCGVRKPLEDFPVLKRHRVYFRCKTCLRKITPEMLYLRDDGVCGICKKNVTDLREASVDHKTPVSLWDWATHPLGPHTFENTQLAHCRCNLLKGNKTADA